MQKSSRYLILLIFLLILNTTGVMAEDFISAIFEPFAGVDIAQTYNNPGLTPFIDAILIFTFLLGLSKISLGNMAQFQGRGGTLVITTFSLILAIAFVIWERANNFNLGQLGPLAAMIFCLALAFFIFRIFQGFGLKGQSSGAFAFVFLYSTLAFLTPTLFSVVKEIPFIWAIANLLFLVSLFISIGGIWKKLKGQGVAASTSQNLQSFNPNSSSQAPLPQQVDNSIKDVIKAQEVINQRMNTDDVQRQIERKENDLTKKLQGELGKNENLYRKLHEHLKELVEIESKLMDVKNNPSNYTNAQEAYKNFSAQFEKLRHMLTDLFRDVENALKGSVEKNSELLIKIEDENKLVEEDEKFLGKLKILTKEIDDNLAKEIDEKHKKELEAHKTRMDQQIEDIRKINQEYVNIINNKDNLIKSLNEALIEEYRYIDSVFRIDFKEKDKVLSMDEIRKIAGNISKCYERDRIMLNQAQKDFVLNMIDPSKKLIEDKKEKLKQIKQEFGSIEKQVQEIIKKYN